MSTTLLSTNLPTPVAAITFGKSGRLGVASEDGIVRIYDAPYEKVAKAVKTTAPEISSLVFWSSAEIDEELWIACGQHVLCFSLSAPRMILERKDAKLDLRLTEEENDVLNEITINATTLAYTLDSGRVGILDLKSHEQARMKISHTNLCSSVSFVPGRPRELVSGGYDSALLHFDFRLKTLLSSIQISGPTEPSAQVSLSPPFVLNISVSQTGLIACGLADGRIWLGSGGEKASSSERTLNERKRRRRKWEGLRVSDGHYQKVAEGPVIAISFVSPSLLLSLTLLGTLTLHKVENGQIQGTIWTVESLGLVKANAMSVYRSFVAVGGIGEERKGIVLVRQIEDPQSSSSTEELVVS